MHNALGHNGLLISINVLKSYIIGLGLRKEVDIYVKQCMKFRQQNLHPQCYAKLHLEVPLIPMLFIVMDLIGKFKPLLQGHQYTLTLIDMLRIYT